ncbi:hypothetical protein FNO01nite_21350 [Flavobacterium noncentrifugens]|uniref:Outer membrane protein beta-barrel domain-containing protein n=1 Tax=Flavobacterium noncentrifugens TaxID=1128970 RepID=A0A1G9AID1_9FLAO|nr:porin family protein [Flavobacterium noncentrifugens]GEP51463.1 hypothetical protein FNO01nite_21350 [Flavobacterium noncentrifugens]SDK27119.1 Outer membrane protein beta-barrel domain-containing protein [Flavobacterium noncentrifugens]
MIKLIAGLLLMVSGTVAAQEKPSFGVNAGATYSNIRGNEYADEFKYGADFLVGVSAEIPLSNKWSVIGNINYERKSFHRDFAVIYLDFRDFNDPSFPTGNVKIKETFSYLAVPVNIKYYIGKQKRFFINGGIYTAFFLGSQLKHDGVKQPANDKDITAVDFGANLGTGVVVKLNQTNRLNIELRDNLGLSDNISFSNIETRTNSLNLILNWQFTL